MANKNAIFTPMFLVSENFAGNIVRNIYSEFCP